MERKDNWVRCPNCGHKLFKMISDQPKCFEMKASDFVGGIKRRGCEIEIKCHSCKKIISI